MVALGTKFDRRRFISMPLLSTSMHVALGVRHVSAQSTPSDIPIAPAFDASVGVGGGMGELWYREHELSTRYELDSKTDMLYRTDSNNRILDSIDPLSDMSRWSRSGYDDYLLSGTSVFIAGSGTVEKVGAQTGATEWIAEFTFAGTPKLLLVGESLLLLRTPEAVHAIQPHSGQEQWRFILPRYANEFLSLNVDTGSVNVIASITEQANSTAQEFTAISADSGQSVFSYRYDYINPEPSVNFQLFNDFLVIREQAAYDTPSLLSVIDRSSNNLVWTKELKLSRVNSISNGTVISIVHEDGLHEGINLFTDEVVWTFNDRESGLRWYYFEQAYVVEKNGRSTFYDLTTGRETWSRDGSFALTGENNQTTLIYSDEGLELLDVKTGERVWLNKQINRDYRILDDIVLVDDWLFRSAIVVSKNEMVLLDGSSGETIWSVPIDADIEYGRNFTKVADSVIFITKQYMWMRAYSLDDGQEYWRMDGDLIASSWRGYSSGVTVVEIESDATTAVTFGLGLVPPQLESGAGAVTTAETWLKGAPSGSSIDLRLLPEGTSITIIGNAVQADDSLWWPVRVQETGEQGWLLGVVLEPSS